MAAAALIAQQVQQIESSRRKVSRVSLSLENCILPAEKLSPTPSQLDGLDEETELELRSLGCEMIQTSGNLLKLPQVAMATGQVLYQRFYYSKSFVRQPMEAVAMASITTASKIEEAPRRVRDVINTFHHIKQMKAGKTIHPLILDQNYINLKNQVIKAERRVLKELGFCVHVKHPHKIIVTLLEVLKVNNPTLTQTAWNYMNDSLRTDVFVRYSPDTIACACIYLSARLLQIPLPNKPAWYLVFDSSIQDLNDISLKILSLYTRKKPDPERLEKIIEERKASHLEAKLKARGMIVNNNQIASSPSEQTSPKNGIKSPESDGKKERKDRNGKHNDVSPKFHKDSNHRKRRSNSPAEDGYQSHDSRKRMKSSSSGSVSSHSSSPKHKTKTPPRGFKDSHRSRSRSKTRNNKRSKHRSSHKRKHSRSPSPAYSPSRHSSKKSYKSKHSDKSHRARSRSRSQDRNHYSNSFHEKSSHRSRRDRERESYHSRDKKRR